MPEVRVQPRSVYEHHIIVTKPNTTLNWTFSTKKKSICFGLYYRPQQQKKQSSARTSLDHSSNNERAVVVKKRNLSLPPPPKVKNNKTTADEIQQHYYSDTEDDGATTTLPPLLKNKRHSMVIAAATSSIKDVSTSSMHSRNRRKSSSAAISVINLLDNDFIELIPIDQYNSSKEPIIGSYLAEEIGNYVLIFDNMFSRNTSKLLTFNVKSDEPIDDGLEVDEYDMSGWLLKKRRKRMQGWAKRWFELSPTGVLSYSVRKGDIKRGSLQILLATIALSPKQRTIHVDSGSTIFHLKALTPESFDAWLDCIRSKRSNNANNVMWDGDLTNGIQSAISLLPDTNNNEMNHQIIARGLGNMENEIKMLKNLITKDLKSVLNNESSTIASLAVGEPSLPSPQSSSSSMKLRFPFKRGASNSNLEENNGKLTPSATSNTIAVVNPISTLMMDKLSQSIKLLEDYREQVSNAYFDNYDSMLLGGGGGGHPLEIPGRTGTGFLSHRSASFYSYSGQSDQFFDAEDVFLTNEENESTYGSIDVDSEDEERRDSSTLSTTATPQPNDLNIPKKDVILRRNKLPHPVAVRTISFLGILRKNIGKDLSTIALPISLNEPINILQRLCEELEYCELLDKAKAQSSSMDRLMYVVAFAISGYASSQYRIGRKPFNPLMCETYECIRPDKGFRFISEKVSHYPNVMACHAESRNFQYRQTYLGKTKFWGKSMELITEGQVHLELTGHSDQYTFSKPSSWLRNLVTGTKYLEHLGEMTVNNHTTGEYAIVTFKEATAGGGSFFSSGGNAANRNNVSCKFYDCTGSLIKEVEGKWSDSLSEVVGPDQYTVLWRSKPPTIPDYQDYYGLTEFAMQINEITSLEEGKIPITDTRYRPDQSLFENGKVSEAEDEKLRIEQLQRERRKQYQLQEKSWDPLWFEIKPDIYSPTGESWQYKGGYWEARNTGQWPKEILKLW